VIKELLDKGCSAKPARRFSSATAMLSHIEPVVRQEESLSGSLLSAGKRGSGGQFGSRLNLLAVVVLLVVGGWLIITQSGKQPFSPLAQMNLVTYPADAGNPNSLSRSDPQGLLRKNSVVVSTSSPQVPERPIRYSRVHVVSNPAAYMLVFWISPTGYISMHASESEQKNFRDPGLRDFRSLDGVDDNYIICAFLKDRPFMNKDGLKAAIERLVQRYRGDHPGQQALPQGVMRVLSRDGIRLAHWPDVVFDEGLRNDFGLLGEIWLQYGNSYPLVGVELPLPSRDQPGVPPPESPTDGG